jgi:hypothetical protein
MSVKDQVHLRIDGSDQFGRARTGPTRFVTPAGEYRMRLSAFVVVLLAAFTAPSQAAALSRCECAVDLVQAARDGRPVFLGTVTKVEFLEALEEDQAEPRIIVDFVVRRSWGDEIPSRITLHTYYNRIECEGYWFREGVAYLLFAYVNGEAERDPEWPKAGTFGTAYCGVYELTQAMMQMERLNLAFPVRP